LKPHLRTCWVIPPEQDAAFVAQMEDILDLYHRPYDPARPLVNMDEQPIQLIQETRVPLPAQLGKALRYDYEYERNGTAAVFMFTEALAGWRKVKVSAQRTSVDWAWEIKELLDVDYPDAEKVILVCDQLNIHTIASLYKAFAPDEARRLAKRLELHSTPKHGSWLNIAEIELSVLTRQCLGTRIPDLQILSQETKAWEQERNETHTTVDWQFTSENARIKLKRLYPKF
jgi:hypothetical protein